jgi:hypothetical protein
MKYEYDKAMDLNYQKSLIKSYKKTIDDALFNFIIVDMINERIAQLDEMSTYAKQKGGYNVYIIDLTLDSLNQANTNSERLCKTNVHNRTLSDIQQILKSWEPLPSGFTKLDVTQYFKAIVKIQFSIHKI